MVRFGTFFHLFLLLTFANADAAAIMTTPQMNQTTTEMTNSTTNPTVKTTTGNDKLSTSVAANPNNSSNGSENSINMLDLLMESVQDLKVIVAFGTGVVLTAIIWGLTLLCCRVKRRNSLNVSDTLEMVSTKALKVNEQQDQATQTHEEGAEGAEVEYSDIDFAALRTRGAEEVKPQETAENEYAEIKKEMTETEPSPEEEQGGEEGGGEERGGEGEERGGEEGGVKEEILDSPTFEKTEGEIKETLGLLTEENDG